MTTGSAGNQNYWAAVRYGQRLCGPLFAYVDVRWDVMADERPDPLAPPEGYGEQPGQQPEEDPDQDLCQLLPCGLDSLWRAWLGDAAEHVHKQCYCGNHMLLIWLVEHKIECTACGNQVKIIRIEPMRGQSPWPMRTEPVPEDLFGSLAD